MPLPNDIAQVIEDQCQVTPGRGVLTFVDTGPDGTFQDEHRSFGELRANGRRLAAWLRSQGVGPGDRFAIMLQNHPEFVEAMVAAAYLGAVFVPIDPRSVNDKLVYMLNFVEARVVIAGTYALDALFHVEPLLNHAPVVLVVGGEAAARDGSMMQLTNYDVLPPLQGDLAHASPDPSSPMFMMFTSGTTGNPKAVVRSHASYVKGMRGLRALGVASEDIVYTGLPLCHINAHSTLGVALSLGLKAVISRKFTKSRLWDICRAYNCTVFTLLGGMIPEIFSVPERADDADNPVRLIIASGMPAGLWGEYRRRFAVEITEVYGSTEAGGVLINREGEGPMGSMGKPPPGMLAAVLDEVGQTCAPHEPGELCFRPATGEAEPVTYFRNWDASRQKVDQGWFRTGDIAHVDEEGWFWFRHRAGGGVRRNGDFVNTTLVETVLAQSPVVADVFVYGVITSANVAGEKTLVAAIVLAPDGTLAAARAWAAERLQKNDVPEIWQLLEAIPKTVSEKPIERDCAALLFAEGLVQAPAAT